MNRRKFVGALVATLTLGTATIVDQDPFSQARMRHLEEVLEETTLSSELLDPNFVAAARKSLHLEMYRPPDDKPIENLGRYFGDWSVGLYLRSRHGEVSDIDVVDEYFNPFSHELSHVFWNMLSKKQQADFKATVYDLDNVYGALVSTIIDEGTDTVLDNSERLTRKAFYGYNILLRKKFEYTNIYEREFDRDIMRTIFSGKKEHTREEFVAANLDTLFMGPEAFAFLFVGGLPKQYLVSSGKPVLYDIDHIPRELHTYYKGFLHPDHF